MRLRAILLLSLSVVFALAACVADNEGANATDAEPAVSYTFDDAPEGLLPYRDRARESFSKLGPKLVGELTKALENEGPAAAVDVCRTLAPSITLETVNELGFDIGRTSHKLRNPDNAPRDWLRPLVEESAGKQAAEMKPRLFDLGDRVGVALPIALAPMCTQCHGSESEISDEVRAVLDEHYPQDKARGFKVGELRGWFWAEIPRD